MDRLETRQLAYFVAVAEELHFARAADRLGIAAPPLSRAITQLERRLGVRLFDRTSRRVDLTPAGRVLLAESRTALNAVDTAVRRTQRAGRPRALVVAVRSGGGAGLLPDLFATHAGVPVEVAFTTDQAAALRDGSADLAFLCGRDDVHEFETVELMREDPVALLPAGHHLAERATVSVADLRREDAYAPKCPPIPFDELVDRVALGRLVVVAGHSAVDRLGHSVVAIPVTDLPSTALLLGWSRPEPAVLAFVRTAKDVAARRKADQNGR